MINTIVAATDGSDHGRKAVAFAADLASKYGARLVLVHALLRGELSEQVLRWAEAEHLTDTGGKSLAQAVSEVPEGRFPASMVSSSDGGQTPYRLLEAVGNKILDLSTETAREHGAGKIERRLLDGDPTKRILETADAEKADILVTGARGLSDAKALLVGSVSHKLAHLAPMTCISVR